MNEIEQRLSELLRAAAPAARPVPLAAVAVRRRRHAARRSAVVAAAAAVAVLTVAAVTATLHGDSGGRLPQRLATGHTVDMAGAVPWTDSPARPYPAPAASAVPRPADARPCAAGDVTASLQGGNGAGGHQVKYVQFLNTSPSTCVLKGYPRVTATAPGRPDLAATDGSFFPAPGPANMAPGQTTLLGLETDAICPADPGGGGPRTVYTAARIALPGGGAVTVAGPPGGFDVTCGLHLSPFGVPQPDPTPVPDPFKNLSVELDVPGTVVAGTTLVYVVALTNPTGQPVGLVPCPSYFEAAIGASAPPEKEAYALNCAAAPAAIGPGATVRFQMRLRVPAGARGRVAVAWAFDGPLAVSRKATLDVTPAAGQRP